MNQSLHNAAHKTGVTQVDLKEKKYQLCHTMRQVFSSNKANFKSSFNAKRKLDLKNIILITSPLSPTVEFGANPFLFL